MGTTIVKGKDGITRSGSQCALSDPSGICLRTTMTLVQYTGWSPARNGGSGSCSGNWWCAARAS